MALPYTLPAGALTNTHRPTPTVINYNGTLYMNVEGNPIVVLKSTDDGQTWSEVSTTNRPTIGNMLVARTLGNTFYFLCTNSASTALVIAKYYADTESWEASLDTVTGSPPQSLSDMLIRSNGDIVVNTTSTQRVMGADYATSVYFLKPSGGSWGAAVLVSASGIQLARQAYFMVEDSTGRIHFFYGTNVTTTHYHKALSTSNVLGTENTITLSTSFSRFARGRVRFTQSAVNYCAFGYVDGSNGFRVARFTESNTPTFTYQLVTSTALLSNHTPSIATDGIKAHAMWVDNATADVYRDNDAGTGTWGTDTSTVTGTFQDAVGAAISYDKLRFVYENNSSQVIYDEIVVGPQITQAAFGFYSDGTESGSVALAATNTNISRDLSSNPNTLLRVRLQNTVANAANATDDYALTIQRNGLSYSNDIINSYSFSEVTSNTGFSETIYGFGQSFKGDGRIIKSIKAPLLSVGSPVGNCHVRIYSHTGDYGVSAGNSAGGTLLASSDLVAVSSIPTSLTQVQFTFSGVNQIQLENNTPYIWIVYYDSGTATNTINIGYDNSSSTHDGNPLRLSNALAWTALSTDIPFELSAEPLISGFNSGNLTEGGATTNRLGAGSGSFVAGKISEDLQVDDLLITASNFTELLYAFNLNVNAYNNNDTVDFKVLRNGSALSAYTVTPRITASEVTTTNLSGTITGTSSVSGLAKAILMLDGTVTGTSSVSGTLSTPVTEINLSGTITGTSNVTGDVNSLIRLEGTITGAGVSSGTAQVTKKLSGVINGTSLTQGTIKITKKLSGTITGTSVSSGTARITKKLSGTITGTSVSSGTARITKKLSGTITGTSNVTGDLFLYIRLEGSTTGTSSASGGIKKTINLGGTSAGFAFASGAGYSLIQLEGSATGTASVSGALKKTINLSGTAIGTSSATGSLAHNIALGGTVTGTSVAQGVATFTKRLTGSATGTSSVTGDVNSLIRLEGSAVGTSSVSGDITIFVRLEGDSTGTSVSQGSGTFTKRLSGAITGISSASGTAKAIITLDGQASGAGVCQGTLRVTKNLSGVITGVAVVQGGIGSNITLDGQATGTSSVQGTFNVIKNFSGSVLGTSNSIGQLLVTRRFSGSILGSSSTEGRSVVIKNLSGSVVGTAIVGGVGQVVRNLSGSCIGNSISTGRFTSIKHFAGSSSGNSSAVGLIQVVKNLKGTIEATSTSAGTFNLTKFLQGFIVGQSLVSGVINLYITPELTDKTFSELISSGALNSILNNAGNLLSVMNTGQLLSSSDYVTSLESALTSSMLTAILEDKEENSILITSNEGNSELE